jgi:hypothetical protein
LTKRSRFVAPDASLEEQVQKLTKLSEELYDICRASLLPTPAGTDGCKQ